MITQIKVTVMKTKYELCIFKKNLSYCLAQKIFSDNFHLYISETVLIFKMRIKYNL